MIVAEPDAAELLAFEVRLAAHIDRDSVSPYVGVSNGGMLLEFPNGYASLFHTNFACGLLLRE